MKKDDVNKKNTVTWCRVNDDGRSGYWRKIFIENFRGEFNKSSKFWEWKELKLEPEPEPEIKPKKKRWIVTQPDGTENEITNLSKYCKEHSLDDGAIYRVLNGKRNHHKGYKIRKGD